jgi:NAD(P)-dependent dehydrogenase (short-subunit alcohol dehydrogenase family)
MDRMAEKTILVTGAARGMGQAQALRLAAEGANVVALDVGSLEETAAGLKEVGGRFTTEVVDVRDADRLVSIADEALEAYGGIDAAITNAGVMRFGGPAWEANPEEWQEQIDINLTGVLNTVKAVVPSMIEREAGSFIMIASGAAIAPEPGAAGYGASKHGVIGLMRTLALEAGPHKVRVNAICPGLVLTPMLDDKSFFEAHYPDDPGAGLRKIADFGRKVNVLPIPWLEVDDIANAVLFLASDESRYVTATTMRVDGGWFEKRHG